MGRVGSGWPRGKKNNLRSKDDVGTVVLSESPWTANRRSLFFQRHQMFYILAALTALDSPVRVFSVSVAHSVFS